MSGGALRSLRAAGQHEMGPKLGAHDRRQLVQVVADERDLLHLSEVEVDRAQEVRHGMRVALGDAPDRGRKTEWACSA